MSRILFLIFSCFPSFSFGGTIFVSLNPNECASCIGNLSVLMRGDHKFPIRFVLEEKYRTDSADLVALLYLEHYKVPYIWSDSVYVVMSYNGLSSVTIANENGTLFSTPLKAYNEPLNQSVLNIESKCDTLILPDKLLDFNYNELLSSSGNLYFCNSLKNEIYVFDIVSRKLNILTLSTENIRYAYEAALGEGSFEWQENNLMKLKVPKRQQLSHFTAHENGVLAVGSYHIISNIVGLDTFVSGFYGINMYNEDTLQGIKVFPDTRNVLGTFMVDKQDSFYSYPNVHFYDGKFHARVRKYDPSRNIRNTRFVAAFTHEEGKAALQLNKVHSFRFPEIYKNGNYANIIFFKDYFMLPLDGRVYSLTDERIISQIPFNVELGSDFFDPPSRYIVDFTMANDSITVLYFVPEKDEYRILRYNSRNQEMLFDRLIPCGAQKPTMEKWDFDYIYYPVAGGRSIIRRSIFDF